MVEFPASKNSVMITDCRCRNPGSDVPHPSINGNAGENVAQDILPGECRRNYFIRIIFCVFENLPAASRA